MSTGPQDKQTNIQDAAGRNLSFDGDIKNILSEIRDQLKSAVEVVNVLQESGKKNEVEKRHKEAIDKLQEIITSLAESRQEAQQFIQQAVGMQKQVRKGNEQKEPANATDALNALDNDVESLLRTNEAMSTSIDTLSKAVNSGRVMTADANLLKAVQHLTQSHSSQNQILTNIHTTLSSQSDIVGKPTPADALKGPHPMFGELDSNTEKAQNALKGPHPMFGDLLDAKNAEKIGKDVAKSFSSGFGKKLASLGTVVMGLAKAFDPIDKVFGGMVKDELEFMVNMRAIAYQTQGLTSDFGDMQKTFQDIGSRYDTVAQTGMNISKYQKLFYTNIKRGVKDLNTTNKVLKSSANAATILDMEAESVAETFMDWHMKLNMNGDQINEMNRGLRDVARTTGVTGAALKNAVDSSAELMKSMQKAGTLNAENAKSMIGLMASAEKFGAKDLMQELLTTGASWTNLYQKAGGQQQAFYFALAKFSGRTNEAMKADFMKTKDSIKASVGGMEKMFEEFTGGRTIKEFEEGLIPKEVLERATVQLQANYGDAAGIGPLVQAHKAAVEQAKTYKDRMEDISKELQKQNLTVQERKKLELDSTKLTMNEGMSLLSQISKSSENAKTLDEAVENASKSNKNIQSDLSTMVEAAMPEGDKGKVKDMSVMEKIQKTSLATAAALQKAGSKKDFTKDLQKAFAQNDMKAIRQTLADMSEEEQKIAAQDKLNADPITKYANELNLLNATLRDQTSGIVTSLSDMVIKLGMIVSVATSVGSVVAFFMNLKQMRSFPGMGGGMGGARTGGLPGGGGGAGAKSYGNWQLNAEKGSTLARGGKKAWNWFDKNPKKASTLAGGLLGMGYGIYKTATAENPEDREWSDYFKNTAMYGAGGAGAGLLAGTGYQGLQYGVQTLKGNKGGLGGIGEQIADSLMGSSEPMPVWVVGGQLGGESEGILDQVQNVLDAKDTLKDLTGGKKGGIFNWFKTKAVGAKDWIKAKASGGFLGKLGSKTSGMWTKLTKPDSILGKTGGFFSKLMKSGGILSKGGGLFGKGLGLLGKFGKPLLKFIPGIGTIMSAFGAISKFSEGKIGEGIVDLLGGLANLIPGVGPFISMAITLFSDYIWGAIKKVGIYVWDSIKDVATYLWDGAKKIATYLKDKVNEWREWLFPGSVAAEQAAQSAKDQQKISENLGKLNVAEIEKSNLSIEELETKLKSMQESNKGLERKLQKAKEQEASSSGILWNGATNAIDKAEVGKVEKDIEAWRMMMDAYAKKLNEQRNALKTQPQPSQANPQQAIPSYAEGATQITKEGLGYLHAGEMIVPQALSQLSKANSRFDDLQALATLGLAQKEMQQISSDLSDVVNQMNTDVSDAKIPSISIPAIPTISFADTEAPQAETVRSASLIDMYERIRREQSSGEMATNQSSGKELSSIEDASYTQIDILKLIHQDFQELKRLMVLANSVGTSLPVGGEPGTATNSRPSGTMDFGKWQLSRHNNNASKGIISVGPV